MPIFPNKKINSFIMDSPFKTKLGRFLFGRKKITTSDSTDVIIKKKTGKVIKTKKIIRDAEGKKVGVIKHKYKKGNRPVLFDPNKKYS